MRRALGLGDVFVVLCCPDLVDTEGAVRLALGLDVLAVLVGVGREDAVGTLRRTLGLVVVVLVVLCTGRRDDTGVFVARVGSV